MFPNLIEATNTYWRKLDQVEAMYQRGEISLDEVDRRVAALMAELGETRRLAVLFLWQSIRRVIDEQRDVAIGLLLVVLVTYGWAVTHFTSL